MSRTTGQPNARPRRPRVEPEPLAPACTRATTPTSAWPSSSRSGSSPDLAGRRSRVRPPQPGVPARRHRWAAPRSSSFAPRTGEIRAHINTCRHRGTRLVAEPGEEKALRCPYHGWTYHLDGKLVGAPEGRTIPCLDKAKLGLFSARVEVFCGLIFVNLDLEAEPLAPQLEGIRPLLDRYLGGEMEPFGKTASTATTQRRAAATGRSRSTTTSRATTCRSPTPG